MHPLTRDNPSCGITVRPIEAGDLSRIVRRCWPTEPAVIQRIFEAQDTIGMAAWVGDTCVGLLHCYRVLLPAWSCDYLPQLSRWFDTNVEPESAPARDIELRGAAWLHTCCHVGRTLVAAAQSDDPDSAYFGRGIGTALARRSAEWARNHDYVAVLAPGAPQGMWDFAIWTGHLPGTTYAKLGFHVAPEPRSHERLPGWARGNSPPQIMREVTAFLAAGRHKDDFYERLMVLPLDRSGRQ